MPEPSRPPARGPRRPSRAALSASAAALSALTVLAGCGHSGPDGGAPAPAVAAARTSPGTAARPAPLPAGWSLVATLQGAAPRFAAPGGRPDGTVPAQWYGAPSTLAVIGQRPGWYRVRLATRPNGSTAWVRASDVTLARTPYEIVVDLAAKRLRLLRAGRVVLNVPAGVGTKQDPTPPGHYFVAMFEQPPSPGYGPFVLVTSAHSTAISDWEGSGDAVIGIHGPLGGSSQIAAGGAALSHGCVRLQDADLVRLRQVPVGSPITITG